MPNLMKQIILLFFSLFTILLNLAAQNEFAPIGAFWKYSYATFGDDRQRLVTVSGDTLVNGQLFKKLHIDDFIDQHYPPVSKYHLYSKDFLSSRNDSVFMGLNQMFLFSFKAQMGDTIRFTAAFNGRPRYGIVDSIGRIDLGGINRRIMYITKYCKSLTTGEITKYRTISKLVENYGLLTEGLIWQEPDCGTADVSIYVFNCYGSGVFRYPTNAICSPTVATNELIESPITISPNPSNTELRVNYPSELTLNSLELMNYLGQKIVVKKAEIKINYQTINVLNVPNGTYFLNLQFDNQRVVKKIIIQH
jgi:hypothetical protein